MDQPDWESLYKNLTKVLEKLSEKEGQDEKFVDDSSNAYMYILFVLTFYAFSIVVLMVKYIRREREGSKLEFYYNEFVKREWYKDKNLYDKTGRRIHFTVDDNNKVVKVARSQAPRIVAEDSIIGVDAIQDEHEVSGSGIHVNKSSVSTTSVVVCIEESNFAQMGAIPKRKRSFHQHSLDTALELRNVTSVEDLDNPQHYEVAKRIDRRISVDIDPIEEIKEISAARAPSSCSKMSYLHQMSKIDDDDDELDDLSSPLVEAKKAEEENYESA